MNSPETPGTLGPAMDPGLRELYGTTDKDLSHAAAARRAAGAMAAKLPASRGPPRTARLRWRERTRRCGIR